MQGPYLRKYGVETTINFVLYETDGVDFKVDATDGGTDCSIMKDEGAEGTCTNDFTDKGTGYSLVLTATEMQAARIVVYVVDAATKAYLDTSIVIETYGNASAQHAMDFDEANGAQFTEAGGTGDHLTAIDLPNQTMDITGNLSGSVGSVTGAVGSVTGAVGSVTGNVGGSVASVTGAVGSVTGAVGSVSGNVDGNVTGSVGSLAAQAKADVNAEVDTALATTTYAEPGQGAPAATATLAAKINYLYKAWRNKKDQTSTLLQIYADDGTTVDHKVTVSSDGTTGTKGEVESGP